MEARLATHDEVRNYFANLGHGNPQIYYNHIVRNDAANVAELFVQLENYDTRETRASWIACARARSLSRVRDLVSEFVQGGDSSPVAVRIVGRDLDTIEESPARWGGREGHARHARVSNPLRVARTNLRLMPDSTQASLLGVPTVEFDRAVRLVGVAAFPHGTFKNDDGEQL